MNTVTDAQLRDARLAAYRIVNTMLTQQRNSWRDAALESAREVRALRYSLEVSSRENHKLRAKAGL